MSNKLGKVIMYTIRHTCLIVKDLEKSLKFYTNVLGFRLSSRDTLTGDYPEKLMGLYGADVKYAKVRDKNDNEIELIQSNRDLKPHMAFTVDDIDAAYEALKEDLVFISPPFNAPDTAARVCHALDMDQNEIEFVQVLDKTPKKRR